MAALALSALTFAISSGVRSAVDAGEGVSPLGPLLMTCPLIASRACWALPDTPASGAFDEPVVELLQEATERDRAAARATRGSLRIIIVLQCLGWVGWMPGIQARAIARAEGTGD